MEKNGRKVVIKTVNGDAVCDTCMYASKPVSMDEYGDRFYCRRHAPSVNVQGSPLEEYDNVAFPYSIRWPVVDIGDWCGEWRRNKD